MAEGRRSFRESWSALWQQPRKWWWLGIPLGGILMFAGGVVLMGGFIAAVELSSTETFCISCHEMRDNVYVEYQKTIHYTNRTGVRATCGDCHVPGPWIPKLIRKVGATFKEVPNHFLGKIDTKEKFEAHRLEMAQIVWDSMKRNGSRECRNCHELAHMDLERQDKSARRKHTLEYEKEKGESCIDCHKGIAHELPDITAGTATGD